MDDKNLFNLLYDIAEYASKNWRGFFTPREIAWTVYNELWEIENEEYSNIDYLIEQLQEDVNNGSEEAAEFLDELYFYIDR